MSNNVETGNVLTCIVRPKRMLYPKDQIHKTGDWCVLTTEIMEVIQGEPKIHPVFNTITIVGNLQTFNFSEDYKLVGKETYNEQYKSYQYEVMYFGQPMDTDDKKGQEIFLTHILTEKQLKNFYEAFENPFEVIKNKDMEKIMSVKGIGTVTAYNIIGKYENSIDLSAIYLELDDYGLTKNMIDKLVETYKSPQVVIEKIKQNPYILITEVNGIGWKKADDMTLKANMPYDSPFRIKAFIQHYLETQALEGNSYVDPYELMDVMEYELGEIDIEVLSSIIQKMYDDKILWHNDENGVTTKVGLMKYYLLEKNISEELKRLNEGDNNFNYNNWETTIKMLEETQGWDFTREQYQAIGEALKNQVLLITGGAGTGKTSVVNGIVKVLKDYEYAQTALSGKASARMSEVTNQKGYTIHRLLKYTPKKGFIYNENIQLPYDIIILDEISMVGGKLFYDLIKAIKTGAKLIMLGDMHQLESIGSLNIAKDICNNKYIKVVKLTTTHRQAKKSAIKTESTKITKEEKLYKRGFVGYEKRGELQDLELDIYDDKKYSVDKCIHYFKKYLPLASDITEIQVLVPIKERGEACTFNLNNRIQDIYNPQSRNKEEIELTYVDKNKKQRKYILREGDKILVNKNNYNIFDEEGNAIAIFNGQQGIIKSIDLYDDIILLDIPEASDYKIVLPKGDWGSIQLAYACTVAKSQGSEFEYVIGCIDYSTPPKMLTRELLYTLMTRAKQGLALCGETKALYKAMTQSFTKYKRTFLQEMLDSFLIN